MISANEKLMGIMSNAGALTCNVEFVHFDEQRALVTESHGLAAFVMAWTQEDATGPLTWCIAAVGHFNAIFKWSVLQVCELLSQYERHLNHCNGWIYERLLYLSIHIAWAEI